MVISFHSESPCGLRISSALANFVPSLDGKLILYALSDGGSDWRTWRVREVDSGRDLPDVVTRNKFGGADWAADGAGFFYSCFDRPPPGKELQAKNEPPDVCFHRLGTDESADRQERIVGIVTESDIVKKVIGADRGPYFVPVEEVMSSPIIGIEERRPITEAADMMNKHRTRHLGVTKGGAIVGVVSVRDFLKPVSIDEL